MGRVRNYCTDPICAVRICAVHEKGSIVCVLQYAICTVSAILTMKAIQLPIRATENFYCNSKGLELLM